jgi:hypothetical protein
MRRFPGIAAAALALLVAAAASAQSYYPKYVFVAVDAVSVQPGSVKVTGILEGQSEPGTVNAPFSTSTAGYADALQACHRAALLAMEKPGAYRLELVTASGWATCTLLRVDP